MAQGDIETYYEDGSWKNKREGTGRAFGAGYGTKDEAVDAGRAAAQADKVEQDSWLSPHAIKRTCYEPLVPFQPDT